MKPTSKIKPIPPAKRRPLSPITTDEERKTKREKEVMSYERAKERKVVAVDDSLFNIKKFNNWLA